MNDIEKKQKIYQELLEEARRINPKKRPGEFSLTEFAKDADVGRDVALAILTKHMEARELTARETSSGTYYSFI